MNTTQQMSIAGVVLGIVSLGCNIYTHQKNKRDIINKIANDLKIDIPETVINEAIDLTILREVSKAVEIASNQIVFNTRQDIRKEIKTAVDDSFNDIRSSVSKEVAKEVANLDMRKLRRDVEEKAKEMVVEKFV